MLTQRIANWYRHLRRPTAPQQVGLFLEELEDRVTPSVSPNDLFVSSLYQGLLGRNADANGLNYWTAQLNAGVTRTQVAQGIAGSPEALDRDVQLFYNDLLNRPADPNGLAYWTNLLQNGDTLDQVKAGILGSNEFYQDAGNTDANFVNALYMDELGRPVEANGLNYWENQLNTGVTRTMVAEEVLASPEALRDKTTAFYEEALGRAPDAGGLNYWTAQLQAGVPETQVLAGILGSPEYFGHVQEMAATVATTDPNQAATDLIAARNLFNGSMPNAEYLNHNLPTLDIPLPAPAAQPANNTDGGDTPAPTGTVYPSDVNPDATTAPTNTDIGTDTTVYDPTDTTADTSDDSGAALDNGGDTNDNSDNGYSDTDTSDNYSGDSGSTDTSDGSTGYGSDGF